MRPTVAPTPLSLPLPVPHRQAQQLLVISQFLDHHPSLEELVLQDLLRGLSMPHQGRPGMSARQVLRVLLVKQLTQLSYAKLAFTLADSVTYGRFCGFERPQETPKRATLQENIAHLTAATLEQLNRVVLESAARMGVETGRTARMDTTVTETNIHKPFDSDLLLDGLKRLTRIMERLVTASVPIRYVDHRRAAKRRVLRIHQAATEEQRRPLYRDLVGLVWQTVNDATHAVEVVLTLPPSAQTLSWEVGLRTTMEQMGRVLDQVQRRVFLGQKVPAAEKLVSLAEPHTEIIVKDRKETHYGHKLCLSVGPTSMVLECQILAGNPADATLPQGMVQRHSALYGKPPRQVVFDGAFASWGNLQALKKAGVKDIVFTKSRGIPIKAMTKSKRTYQRLRRFRAGVEGCISFLKRAFGLRRCLWKGQEGFAAYVWAGIVTANLLVLARHLI